MGKTRFVYSKLKGRIIEMCGTQKVFAEKMGMSECTLTSKLRGYTYFSQPEIFRAVKILEIDPATVTQYFFTL